MAYIIVITSLHPTELRPLLQYDDNNGVSLSPSHFFFLLVFLAAAAVIFHCRPPSEPKGEKECAGGGDRDKTALPLQLLVLLLLAVQYVNRLA